MKLVHHKFIILLFFIFSETLPVSVGSDSAFSRQSHVVFPEADSDNKMKGFAAFEGGFTLENANVSCYFDSLMPVSGPVDMFGGTITLSKDMIFDGGSTFTRMGSFYGDNHIVELAETVTTFTAYASDIVPYSDDIKELDRLTLVTRHVGWSYDDQYFFTENVDADRNNCILYAYSFDGSDLTLVDTALLFPGRAVGDSKAVSMSTHPNSYYVALGSSGWSTSPSDVAVYKLSGSSLTFTYSVRISENGICSQLGWSRDGNYLAICTTGIANFFSVRVFRFEDEILTEVVYINKTSIPVLPFEPNGVTTIPWDQTGKYFAVSLVGYVGVVYFDSDTNDLFLTQTYATKTYAVDWSHSYSYIAVACNLDRDVKILEYDSDSNTISFICSSGLFPSGYKPRSVAWSSDDSELAVALTSDADEELKTYIFTPSFTADHSLTYQKGFSSTQENSYSVRWSNDDQYIGFSYANDDAIIVSYETEAAVNYHADSGLFDDLKLRINSNLTWDMNTYIQGDCIIDGNNKIVTFGDDGFFFIRNNSSLILQNIELAGISSKLECIDDTGVIGLRNCSLNLSGDYTFSHGAISFVDDVRIKGEHKFLYSSAMASTINSESRLIIDKGVTFSYDPPTANRDLIYMVDDTSILYLDGCILHATPTAPKFMKGQLILDNNVTFSCEGTSDSELITFGDGSSSSNDLKINILSDSYLTIYGGLYDDNVD